MITRLQLKGLPNQELRPIMLGMQYGMSNKLLFKNFSGILQFYATEMYFQCNDQEGIPEGAD